MPTTRKRVSRHPRNSQPDWAEQFLRDGTVPPQLSGAWHQYLGWKFFGERVPGLPDEGTAAGRALIGSIRDAN